ncbi:MAG: thiamine pyrophosphate-dependent enzyme [Candidatus Bathyarchaeota archaeon]|nr:thiamine pyrophosphate-dependent enzyme [Candidatus Bathyarchaeota archaeon]MDH5787109.1 thiamine pyrophosphate-dependent enzyme [Candidatus Bathyarchaeota archaeon]
MMVEAFSPRKYMRDLKFPFCPGCGLFSVSDAFLRAVHELGYKDLSKFVFCSGIGCSSWVPSPYYIGDSLHTLHGRSIPVATSVKLVRPDLNVVVFGGDGDIVGIGLGHFIHAARRNADVLVIMTNNMIYGMTGGQVAPTTPLRTKTTTTPYGSFEHPIDAARLAAAAGAAYSARWTTAHPNDLRKSIKKAIQTKGFGFIEAVSQCPTAYGRRAGFKDIGEMLKWFKESAIAVEQSKKMSEKELEKRIVVGEFVQRSRPTLVETVYAMIEEAKAGAKQN